MGRRAILSLDGGGSKGVMEVVVLDTVFKIATHIREDVQTMPSAEEFLSAELEERKQSLEKVEKKSDSGEWKLLHPTHAFDMIVGTSTGSLIAFGLLAGNVDKTDGKRCVMTLHDIKTFYLEHSKKIFSETHPKWLEEKGFEIVTDILGDETKLLYSQKPLEKLLKRQFGEHTRLGDVKGPIGGCVARRVDDQYGSLEFFCTADATANEPGQNPLIYEVLLASSDAPIFFYGPAEVQDRGKFVDGGVGGNCPLMKAIPEAKKRFGDDVELTVLSVAPPQSLFADVPEGSKDQIKYWLKFFPSHVTSGGRVFYDMVEDMNANQRLRFFRLFPESKELLKFQMDSLEIEEMIKETNEWIWTKEGMADVLTVVVAVVVEMMFREDDKSRNPDIIDWLRTSTTFLIHFFKSNVQGHDGGLGDEQEMTNKNYERKAENLLKIMKDI